MDRQQLKEIRAELKEVLKPDRYEHTLGVEYTAAALAMRYGADVEKAELAGLLHDCAKQYSDEEIAMLLMEHGIMPTQSELRSPGILHAIYGPILAQERYGIDDEEVLSAIRWHTTGKADMSVLEKIVFTADYIEPSRREIDAREETRGLAFMDLTYTVFRITYHVIGYLHKKGMPIEGHTSECYEYLSENGVYDEQ